MIHICPATAGRSHRDDDFDHRNVVCRCNFCTFYFLVMSTVPLKRTIIITIFRRNVLTSHPHIFSLFPVMQEVSHTQKQTHAIELGLCASYTFSLCSSVVELWLPLFSLISLSVSVAGIVLCCSLWSNSRVES